MKKSICIVLSLIMLIGIFAVAPVTASAAQTEKVPTGYEEPEISETNAESSEITTTGSIIPAEGSEIPAEGSEVPAEGSEVPAEGSEISSNSKYSDAVILYSGIAEEEDYLWVAWTWSDNKDAGTMVRGIKVDDHFVFWGLSDNVTFKRVFEDEYDGLEWADIDDYQTIDYEVEGNSFIITNWSEEIDEIFDIWGFDYYVGNWSDIELTDEMVIAENPIKISAATKTVKLTDLKNADVTINPFTINKAEGEVTIELDASTSSEHISDNIDIDSVTGAVTIRKGSYSDGTYNVVITAKAAGNDKFKEKTVSKTASIVFKDKKANTLTAKAKTKSLKLYYMKKTKKTIKLLNISKAKGKVKVVKVSSGTSKAINKKISVNSKTGAITFKKGSYKKGTYKIKLKVTAAGNDDYKKKSVTKVTTIKLKDRKANPFHVNAYNDAVFASSLKKGKQTIKPFYIHDAQGKVKVTKLKKGTSKKIFKKITVTKTGSVVFKKGKYKLGTYKIKVKFTAKGNGEYKPKTVKKTITVTIKKEQASSSSSSSSPSPSAPGYNTMICGACGGRGYTSFTIMRTQTIGWNPVTGIPQTIQMPETQNIPCGTCGGDGRI